MSNIKLYTEEEVTKAIGIYFLSKDDVSMQDVIEQLTPIKLPSDEEIERNAYTDRRVEDLEYHEQIGFERGAIWMKQQILNQNK